MSEDSQTRHPAADEHTRALEPHPEEPVPLSRVDIERLPELIADAAPEALGRVVLAVAAQHDLDADGWCRVCADHLPRRWVRWGRASRPAPGEPCCTQRLIWAELFIDSGPQFTPA